jgi:hypothetical protein
MGKLYGPFGFAEMSALAVGATMLIAPSLLGWVLPQIAFFQALWLGSLLRQILYEQSTVGTLTTNVNPCSGVFLPPEFVFLLCFAFASGSIIRAIVLLRAEFRDRESDKVKKPRIFGQAEVTAFVGLAGAVLGFLSWSDWQVPTSCL